MNKNYNFNANMYKIVSKNIKKYREIRKLSLEELSSYTDIKLTFLKKLEELDNDAKISIYDLYKISIILETSIDKFFIE